MSVLELPNKQDWRNAATANDLANLLADLSAHKILLSQNFDGSAVDFVLSRSDVFIRSLGIRQNNTSANPRLKSLEIKSVGSTLSHVLLEGVHINNFTLNADNGPITNIKVAESSIRPATGNGIKALGTGANYIVNVVFDHVVGWDYATWDAIANNGFVFWDNDADGCGQIRFLNCAYNPYSNGGALKAVFLHLKHQLDSITIDHINPVIPVAALTNGCEFIHLDADAKLLSCIVNDSLFEPKCNLDMVVIDDSGTDSSIARCDVDIHHSGFCVPNTKTTNLIVNSVVHDAAWNPTYYNRVAYTSCHGRDNTGGTMALGTAGVLAHFLNPIKGCSGSMAALNN